MISAFISVRPMCSTPHKKVFHSIYFVYVIEECISFHLVYRLLLMRIVLGWAIFYHKSPELFAWQCFGQMAVEWRRMLLCHITAGRSQKAASAYFASKQMLHFRLADHISPARLMLFLVQETSKVGGRYKHKKKGNKVFSETTLKPTSRKYQCHTQHGQGVLLILKHHRQF